MLQFREILATNAAALVDELADMPVLQLDYGQRAQCRQRVRLDNGEEAALLLPRGTVLKHGDILQSVDGHYVLVQGKLETVNQAHTPDSRLLQRAAYHLGNRHVSLQFGADSLYYQPDAVLDEMLRGLGLHVAQTQQIFSPEPGAYSSATPSTHPDLGHSHDERQPPQSHTTQASILYHMAEQTVVSLNRQPVAKPSLDGDQQQTALLRLLQLTSPSLPVGAYAYSQGLEQAIAQGWVTNEPQAADWIIGLLQASFVQVDVPYCRRLYEAWQQQDAAQAEQYSRLLLVSRESRELVAEDRQLGQALARLLNDLGLAQAQSWVRADFTTYAAMFTLAASHWQCSLHDAVAGYLWAWCENQVAAAIKLVPLGQTAGQRMLSQAVEAIPQVVSTGLQVTDEDIGFSTPGLAMASAWHESQYTRLFRS